MWEGTYDEKLSSINYLLSKKDTESGKIGKNL